MAISLCIGRPPCELPSLVHVENAQKKTNEREKAQKHPEQSHNPRPANAARRFIKLNCSVLKGRPPLFKNITYLYSENTAHNEEANWLRFKRCVVQSRDDLLFMH